jgi:methyl-accepting chemotaxis protein
VVGGAAAGFPVLVDAMAASAAAPPVAASWNPPAGLADSLNNIRAGVTARWWFVDGDRLIAAVPVLDGTVPVGVVIATASRSSAIAEARQLVWDLILYPVVTILASVVLALGLARGLTRRIESLAIRARVLALGDLRRDMTPHGRDELGIIAAALAELANKLRGLLDDARGGAGDVSAAADQLAQRGTELRASSNQLAASARAIASASEAQRETIDSITALAASAVDQAAVVAGAAVRARGFADDIDGTARGAVDEAASARATMRKIGTVAGNSLLAVSELESRSRRIGSIAHTIGGLASQASLLSLNAEIEAARAGEQGRGFGVVAAEMRRLSTATDAALDSILELAHGMEAVSQRTANGMHEVNDSVSNAVMVVDSAAAALEAIVAAIAETRTEAHAIVAQAEEQQQRAGLVAVHVANIAAAAADNAASAHQVSSLAESQSVIAVAMQDSTLRLGAIAVQLGGSLDGFVLQ